MLNDLQRVYFCDILCFILITFPDRWKLEYISLHAILTKNFWELWRFFFIIFFPSWKPQNERHYISMLVIWYTGQCIWTCQFFYFYFVLITCDMFSWEKLLKHIWIGMIKWKILFRGNKIDFLLLRFLYMVAGLYDFHWHASIEMHFITVEFYYRNIS